MSFSHLRTRLWTERVSLGARNRQMNRMTMRTSSFSGTSHRRQSSSATADPGREPSCPQGSRHEGGLSRPRISRTHLGVYVDRMYGSDILCSRELLSRGQSELQPLLIKLGGFLGHLRRHTDLTYSLRSSAPCGRFVRTAGSQNFRNVRFVPEKLAQKSELSLHRMAVRAFFGQQIRAECPSNGCADDLRTKIRAERPSNGCADDLRTKIRAERLSNGYRSQGPTEPPLHRNSVLLVEAHWSVAFSCLGTSPDFGSRLLCVLESCLLLSRTATHGQSPGACVDVPSLTCSLCWRSHKRREALRPRLCLSNSRHKPTRPLDVDTCFARPCARCFVCPSRALSVSLFNLAAIDARTQVFSGRRYSSSLVDEEPD